MSQPTREEIHALLTQYPVGALANVLIALAHAESNLEALDLMASIIDRECASGLGVTAERLNEQTVCYILLKGEYPL